MGLLDTIGSAVSNSLWYNPMTAPFMAAKSVYNYATQPSAEAVAQSAALTQQAYDWDRGYTEGRTVAPIVATNAGQYPGGSYYTVKSGDTLSKIAAKYGTTYQNIMAWNGLKGTTIYPGDRLLIRSASAESAFLTNQAAALDQAYASGRTVLTATPTSGAYGPVGAPAATVSGGASLEKYLPYLVGGLLLYKVLGKKGSRK